MWRASFEQGVGVVDPHPIEDQVNFFLAEVVPNNKVRVVLEGGSIVAFMASTPESVSHLYVRVQAFGQGIGSRLLALAKTESQGTLWLHTFAKNERARRFYEKRGFREVERESANMWKLEAIKYQWVKGSVAA
jgi:ribosomal protein S18 acetylase RimI-like enzyme